ncbi:hypothetical protein [Mycobacteroides abscessus]|uniref:hypothetical protein n=1 Tax=Mycobacteroides abscessus TaxID=36809 RepID=UPI00232D7CB2|nr:hypothetical protein [Mycobacteroides abscessus]MDB2197581.1 hypothetical protein [Mycobacteroides abscessus subsp. abscessus]MDB2202043.1 hypothetical protein [Mycobacteroides abscessus subsp. abscessus]
MPETAGMLTALFGFCVGFPAGVLTLLAFHRLRLRASKAVPPSAVLEDTYGHPLPPVSTLRGALPDPPNGHAWEISVQHDGGGTPFLHVGIVKLNTGDSAGGTKKDLMNDRYSTWASKYRLFTGDDEYLCEIFRRDFIGPLTDWATAQVNRLDHANDIGVYTISGDRQGMPG